MKSILSCVAGLALGGVLLFVALNPESGAVYANPGAALGIGLIGLGSVIEMKKRAALAAAKAEASK